MPIDDQELVNEIDITLYDHYLCSKPKSELLGYFIDMEIKTLVEFIKEEYGNDGRDDCNFESEG